MFCEEKFLMTICVLGYFSVGEFKLPATPLI